MVNRTTPGRGIQVILRATEGSYTSFLHRRLEMQAEPSSPVYFILHIPKTAGQTIQHHMADHCAPGVFWGPHQAPRLQVLSGRRYDPDSLPEAPRVRAIFGHNLGRSLEKYFLGREIRARCSAARSDQPAALAVQPSDDGSPHKGAGDLQLRSPSQGAAPRLYRSPFSRALARDPVAGANGDDRPTEIRGDEPGAVAILVCRFPYRL